MVRRARETHERHALVGMHSTAAKDLGHADDGASEVDVACSLAVYGAVRFDLVGRKIRLSLEYLTDGVYGRG